MKFLRSSLICITWSLLALVSSNTTAASDDYTINPCPSGFQFAHFHETDNWDVCIESELYIYNNVGDQKDTSVSCPLITTGDTFQAWNPEAGVCFTSKNSPGDEHIFTVTRDSDKGRILVDVFPSKKVAGCTPSSGEAYLISPAEIYCLKDLQTEPYNAIEIEGQADDYFQRLLACKRQSAKELRETVLMYQQYLEFAYYRNANIEINLVSGYRISKASSSVTFPNQGIDDLATSEHDCDIPNVSKMIGITY